MRAKVIRKPAGLEQFYGRVGKVIGIENFGGEDAISLEFSKGERATFRRGDLRLDVRPAGEVAEEYMKGNPEVREAFERLADE